MSEVLMEVRDAVKEFVSRGKFGEHASVVTALNHVDLTLYKGETMGLVGESGSGKTTLGRSMLTLETLTSGTIRYKGQALETLKGKEKQAVLNQMQIIFQDPYSALNPRLTALQIVMEPLLHLNREDAKQKAVEILEFVGITGDAMHKRPKAFSGGQRQRIGIARAVVGQPEFILCDEPTSALDVSIQAQILQLLVRLQKEFGLTYLFISHDLSVVRYIADRIAVMYQGHLVEVAKTEQLFANPQHPYTKKLLATAPIANPEEARKRLAQEHLAQYEQFTLSSDDSWKEIEEGHLVRIAKVK